MNELLAKLTNLGYELFGVVIPGLIAALFFLLWWSALGPLAPKLTFLPVFTLQNASSTLESLGTASGIGIGVPLFAVCYFLGHIVLWVSRSGKQGPTNGWRRVCFCLIFRIPKPQNHYSSKLQRLYDKVQVKFAPDQVPLEWREFYPVVKSFLSKHLSNSLISTYQNKYTLHRSITTVSAALFWLCFASFTYAFYECVATSLNYLLIGGLGAIALVMVWGFSSSYVYHWEMFGNTVITESYSLLFGPEHEPKE